jgi:hypothetical protein
MARNKRHNSADPAAIRTAKPYFCAEFVGQDRSVATCFPHLFQVINGFECGMNGNRFNVHDHFARSIPHSFIIQILTHKNENCHYWRGKHGYYLCQSIY